MPPAVTMRPSRGDDLGAGADRHARRHAVHEIRVARVADRHDAAVADADVGLDDPPVVHDQRVGDHQVERARGPGGPGRLAHRVAENLAAAELRLLAGHGQVALHPDEELGVRQSHAIARRRPVEVGVLPAPDPEGHRRRLPVRQALERRIPGSALREPVQAREPALTGDLDQHDPPRVPGLEPRRRAGRDVEPHAEREGAVEPERPVHLEEVEVRAHLDRAVAGVADVEADRAPPLVRDHLAVRQDVLARDHGVPPSGSGGERSRASCRPGMFPRPAPRRSSRALPPSRRRARESPGRRR